MQRKKDVGQQAESIIEWKLTSKSVSERSFKQKIGNEPLLVLHWHVFTIPTSRFKSTDHRHRSVEFCLLPSARCKIPNPGRVFSWRRTTFHPWFVWSNRQVYVNRRAWEIWSLETSSLTWVTCILLMSPNDLRMGLRISSISVWIASRKLFKNNFRKTFSPSIGGPESKTKSSESVWG